MWPTHLWIQIADKVRSQTSIFGSSVFSVAVFISNYFLITWIYCVFELKKRLHKTIFHPNLFDTEFRIWFFFFFCFIVPVLFLDIFESHQSNLQRCLHKINTTNFSLLDTHTIAPFAKQWQFICIRWFVLMMTLFYIFIVVVVVVVVSCFGNSCCSCQYHHFGPCLEMNLHVSVYTYVHCTPISLHCNPVCRLEFSSTVKVSLENIRKSVFYDVCVCVCLLFIIMAYWLHQYWMSWQTKSIWSKLKCRLSFVACAS